MSIYKTDAESLIDNLIQSNSTSTDTQDIDVYIIADKLQLPYIITPGNTLPNTIGEAVVTWLSSNTNVIDEEGNVNSPLSGISDEVELTTTVILNEQKIIKSFTVRVIESLPNYILSYICSGNNNLTNSMHLGYSADGENFTALNNNVGVLFAKSDVTDNTIPGVTESLTNPYIFRMKDLSFGVIAIRTNALGKVLFCTSRQLTSYKEIGLITLSETQNINNPICEYNSELRKYKINWVGDDGVAYYNTTDDFTVISEPKICDKVHMPLITTNITNAIAVNIIPITRAEGKVITNKLAPIVNTGVNDIKVTTNAGIPITINDLGKATLTYSDGTTDEKVVIWNESDFDKIDFNREGIYNVRGIIKKTSYPFPMITRRADPNVIKYCGKYYFIATNESEQVTLEIRVADTILDLAGAEDHNIFDLNSDSDGAGLIWAPEFHEINGELYIFVTVGLPTWDTVQCHVMKLRNGGDPTNSADWGCMQRFLKSNGSFLYTEGITLDMTYFENDGKSYVIWAQRYIGAHIGLSELYIGEVNAIEPWKLICDPVLICSPDYGWDRYSGEVDEGPFAIKHNGKIFITFSGSGTDDSYCVGLLTAEEGTDILSKESWVKTNYPILTTESVPRQYGPGHNCFTIDEDGNDILIYHARLAQGSRDMSARRIHWAADGTPILNMTDEEELAPQFKNVSITVKVINYK